MSERTTPTWRGPALASGPERVNVARDLVLRAQASPAGVGLIVDRAGRSSRATWSELDRRAAALHRGLASRGVGRGDRALILIRPGVDWLCLVHALWRAGAVPVMLDPGMGRQALLASIEGIRAKVLVGSARAQLAKLFWPRAFASVGLNLRAGFAPGAGLSLDALAQRGGAAPAVEDTAADDQAAILFTSGATGTPKGVLYTHGNFEAQARALREQFGMRAGEVDLACFPLFALFNAALGSTSVLPDIDFAHPARCEPSRILDAIARHGAVQSFGSPAIWRRVLPYARASGRNLAPIARLMIAGATVPLSTIEGLRPLLAPGGEIHTPYGATEALPVSNARGEELVGELGTRSKRGAGACIGGLAPGIEARVIGIDDGPIARWSDELALGAGAAGELVVRGPAVTREYAFEPEATARAKVADTGGAWHRMGDVVRFDEAGRLWFLGRVAHRLETHKGALFPVPIEIVFDQHEYVESSALVGVGPRGAERPVIVVVPKPEKVPRGAHARQRFELDILRTGAWFPQCALVERVLLCDSLPVDSRHNAKIDRLALKRWAEQVRV